MVETATRGGRVYFLSFAEVLISPLDMSIRHIWPWPEHGVFTY